MVGCPLTTIPLSTFFLLWHIRVSVSCSTVERMRAALNDDILQKLKELPKRMGHEAVRPRRRRRRRREHTLDKNNIQNRRCWRIMIPLVYYFPFIFFSSFHFLALALFPACTAAAGADEATPFFISFHFGCSHLSVITHYPSPSSFLAPRFDHDHLSLSPFLSFLFLLFFSLFLSLSLSLALSRILALFFYPSLRFAFIPFFAHPISLSCSPRNDFRKEFFCVLSLF
ncbi:hypothetical protein EDD21DRAFT_392719 [Dissophora ornata]|nr:hypothetical protein EDD21DRAFT_392719 [Dissophora ornata]